MIAVRWLVWLIVVVLAVAAMLADPATTAPPCGRAFGAGWAWPFMPGSSKVNTNTACNAVLRRSAARSRRLLPVTRAFKFLRVCAMSHSRVAVASKTCSKQKISVARHETPIDRLPAQRSNRARRTGWLSGEPVDAFDIKLEAW